MHTSDVVLLKEGFHLAATAQEARHRIQMPFPVKPSPCLLLSLPCDLPLLAWLCDPPATQLVVGNLLGGGDGGDEIFRARSCWGSG